MCKKCKKAFRKDMTAYEESDEYCPHCDNHYVSLSHVICIYFLSADLYVFRRRSSRRRHHRLSLDLKERMHALIRGTLPALSLSMYAHPNAGF